jgi:hypothetical protein
MVNAAVFVAFRALNVVVKYTKYPGIRIPNLTRSLQQA